MERDNFILLLLYFYFFILDGDREIEEEWGDRKEERETCACSTVSLLVRFPSNWALGT